MLKVDTNGVIQLTRGDTARLFITIENETIEEEYEVASTDILRLTVRKSVNDPAVAFQKCITGKTMFHIEPKDTKRLSFGSYVYDVELTTADGDVYTVVGPAPFELLKEVTY